VATGVGIAFLPRMAVATAHPDIVVRPVAPTPPMRRIFAVFRAGGLRSPTTGAMVTLLQEISADAARLAGWSVAAASAEAGGRAPRR